MNHIHRNIEIYLPTGRQAHRKTDQNLYVKNPYVSMCLPARLAGVVQILVSLLGSSIKVKVEPQETGWAINYHIADLCEKKQ